MPKSPQSIDPKFVEHLASTMEFSNCVPKGFAEDFREWAQEWPESKAYKNSVNYQKWEIELRPYHITELTRLPSMPKRTKLHELLRDLNVPKDEMRDASGRLKTFVVKMILDRLTESRIKINNKKKDKE
jgi:hypothetical protein